MIVEVQQIHMWWNRRPLTEFAFLGRSVVNIVWVLFLFCGWRVWGVTKYCYVLRLVLNSLCRPGWPWTTAPSRCLWMLGKVIFTHSLPHVNYTLENHPRNTCNNVWTNIWINSLAKWTYEISHHKTYHLSVLPEPGWSPLSLRGPPPDPRVSWPPQLPTCMVHTFRSLLLSPTNACVKQPAPASPLIFFSPGKTVQCEDETRFLHLFLQYSDSSSLVPRSAASHQQGTW